MSKFDSSRKVYVSLIERCLVILNLNFLSFYRFFFFSRIYWKFRRIFWVTWGYFCKSLYRWHKKTGIWKTQQKCKTFLWLKHAVDLSTDPWLLNGEVVCSSRSLFRSAANCTWLPLRISEVLVLLCHTVSVRHVCPRFVRITIGI